MAMLTRNKSQEDMQSWIRANYNNLIRLYFCFFERYPLSKGPISQPSISRIFAMLSSEYMNELVSKLGQNDFQKAWIEYAKYRVKIIEERENKQILLRIKQRMMEKSLRVLSVDGKARKGVVSVNGKTEIDLTIYDIISEQTLHRITIPEKSGESTVFTQFLSSGSFDEIVQNFEQFSVILTTDAGITSRLLTKLLTISKASYCLSVKGNAGNVFDIIQNMDWSQGESFEMREKSHGRNETRRYKVLYLKDLETTGLFNDVNPNDPKGLLTEYKHSIYVVQVTSERVEKNKKSMHQRYFILGGKAFEAIEVEIIAGIIRSHWQIESNHWVKDVVMVEDNCQTKTSNSSQILGSLRDISLGLAKLFTRSPTQFIRELQNNIKDLWFDIEKGFIEEKKKSYG